MLIALTRACRAQSLNLLSIHKLRQEATKFILYHCGHLKQYRVGVSTPYVELFKYPEDTDLCVYSTLQEYLDRTSSLRENHKCLFISYVKPFKPVTNSTVSRWIKYVMSAAGINCDIFKAHSVRSASTSKAFLNNVCIQDILKVAGWTNAKTFAQYYNKTVSATNCTFADAVLQNL